MDLAKNTYVMMTLFAMIATSCAHPRAAPNDRKGLLDRFAEMDHARAPILPKPELKSQNREPDSTELVDFKYASLRWPLAQVRVTSPFGQRGKEFHEGVDLHAPVGTAVFAAASGTVIYADTKIRGYGKMIVIRHHDGVSTVYGHNSKLLVRRGQKVIRGQKIAVSGSTGRSHGPHLHFEVRSGVKAVDPTRVLPRKSSLTAENQIQFLSFQNN